MDLSARIDALWEKRGASYRPRTRHLDSEGRPIYTNRLFLETSPYLLQHAHNPVDWFPWGDEAFDTARRLNRPVLLSVGYSTCHWCHVMEEESFEDEEIARAINERYIAVKVDREERPDVDAIYMSAVQVIIGRGGWPMTVWLNSAREPFYGGTYFPARDGDRGSPMGFLTLLKRIRESYDCQRERVDRSAAELTRSIHRMLDPGAGEGLPGKETLDRAVSAAKTRFDARHGGLSGAPKFPSSLPIRLMLRRSRSSGDAESRHMAVLTLERMAAGGINDQVGGGFHRYSTDDRWLVPHFEKMLYDNALLVPAYVEGWQATGNPRFRQVVRCTLDYVAREMTAPYGAFYSASDADSLTPDGRREEGYYFTWTPKEIETVLGAQDARIAIQAYGVTEAGTFDGRNVLHLPKDPAALAADLGLSEAALGASLERINRILYERRRSRPAPLRDEKILAAWNGLMISAFARAGFALDDAAAIERAIRAADFILGSLLDRGRLKRSYKDGVASGHGFLEDYAFLTAGLLDLFSVTASRRWLNQALALDRILADHFEDRENGGFFMTADDHEALIAREKPFMDGAVPSGNAVALMNLVRLHGLTMDASYRRRAEKGLTAFSTIMEANPSAFGEMLLAFDDFLKPPFQVVVIVPENARSTTLVDRLRIAFLPGGPIIMASEAEAARLDGVSPIFQAKAAVDGQMTAYVCGHGSCEPPVTDSDALLRRLDREAQTEGPAGPYPRR